MESIENDQAPKIEIATDNTFWKWGLRTVLFVDLCISGIEVLRLLLAGGGAGWMLINAEKRGQFLLDLGPMAIFAFALPITFFVSSVGCLMLKPTARILMIVYCCAEIGFQIGGGLQISMHQDAIAAINFWFTGIATLAYHFGVLTINLAFMTKPQIKTLFDNSRPATAPE